MGNSQKISCTRIFLPTAVFLLFSFEHPTPLEPRRTSKPTFLPTSSFDLLPIYPFRTRSDLGKSFLAVLTHFCKRCNIFALVPASGNTYFHTHFHSVTRYPARNNLPRPRPRWSKARKSCEIRLPPPHQPSLQATHPPPAISRADGEILAIPIPCHKPSPQTQPHPVNNLQQLPAPWIEKRKISNNSTCWYSKPSRLQPSFSPFSPTGKSRPPQKNHPPTQMSLHFTHFALCLKWVIHELRRIL